MSSSSSVDPSLFLVDPYKSSLLTDHCIPFDDGRSEAGAKQTAGVKPRREFRQSRVTLTPPSLDEVGRKKSQQSPTHNEHGGSGGDFGAATALDHDR